jgi:diguanylate cyclase (GGDEF)-like protein
MRKFLYNWRFYSFGREQYQQCMNNSFINNLQSLQQGNLLVTIFVVLYAIIPLVAEKLNFIGACVCLIIAFIAMLVYWYANYVMQQINVKNGTIYFLTSFSYANLMFFGIYQNIVTTPDKPASLIFIFFAVSLLLYVNPPHFNLILTLSGALIFIASTIIVKASNIWIYDIVHILIAGSLCLFFSWHITKLRMGLELSASELEEERNKYEDQSITDELTQLRNKRDFTNTFQRYLSNYRSSDDWLCVAIADIDFFKLYNDHYGHLKGDDCLRNIGTVLNDIKDDLGVYTARVGGEEFAALWFEKDIVHVDDVITHWIKAIKTRKIPHEKSKVYDFISMSIGVYISRCGAYHDTKILYDLADKALYTAKQGGRNCAIINGDDIKEYKISLKDD